MAKKPKYDFDWAERLKKAKAGDHNSEEFHRVLLETDSADVEAVIDKSKERMKARGLSQEAVDLAYGKPKQ